MPRWFVKALSMERLETLAKAAADAIFRRKCILQNNGLQFELVLLCQRYFGDSGRMGVCQPNCFLAFEFVNCCLIEWWLYTISCVCVYSHAQPFYCYTKLDVLHAIFLHTISVKYPSVLNSIPWRVIWNIWMLINLVIHVLVSVPTFNDWCKFHACFYFFFSPAQKAITLICM